MGPTKTKSIADIERQLAELEKTLEIVRELRAEEEDKDYRNGYLNQMDNIFRRRDELNKELRKLKLRKNK